MVKPILRSTGEELTGLELLIEQAKPSEVVPEITPAIEAVLELGEGVPVLVGLLTPPTIKTEGLQFGTVSFLPLSSSGSFEVELHTTSPIAKTRLTEAITAAREQQNEVGDSNAPF